MNTLMFWICFLSSYIYALISYGYLFEKHNHALGILTFLCSFALLTGSAYALGDKNE